MKKISKRKHKKVIQDLRVNDTVWVFIPRDSKVFESSVYLISTKEIRLGNETFFYKRTQGDETSWIYEYDKYGLTQVYLNKSDAYIARRNLLAEMQDNRRDELLKTINLMKEIESMISDNENEITNALLEEQR